MITPETYRAVCDERNCQVSITDKWEAILEHGWKVETVYAGEQQYIHRAYCPKHIKKKVKK